MAFRDIIDPILQLEGGFVDHPSDRGGRTNLGITQTTLDNARKSMAFLPQDVKDLNKDHAKQIYETFYWNVKSLNLDSIDRLNPAVANILFDMAINSGTSSAAKCLQQVLGVNMDGVIGPISLAAIRDYNGNLAEDFLYYRLNYYYGIIANNNSQAVFARGWRNRLIHIAKACGIEDFLS